MSARTETVVCIAMLAVTLATHCAEYDKNANTVRYILRSFCFINEDCPNLQLCKKHQCKLPTTAAELRTVAKIFNSRRRHVKSEDEPCIGHFDCREDNYLCDMQQGRCRKAHEVFLRLTNKCGDLKKSCHLDSDCSCTGYRMRCEAEASGEERECVIVHKPSPSRSSMLRSSRRISDKSKLTVNEVSK